MRLWGSLLGVALFLSIPLRAQMSDVETCFGYPTFADEIREAGGRSDSHEIRVQQLRFSGTIHLTSTNLRDIASELKKHSYTGLEELLERARDAWQARGYFKAVPYLQSAKDLGNGKVSVTVRLEEGPQYRFKSVSWEHASVFTADQLTALIPLRPGEVFNTYKIREGFENLRRAYLARGYLDMTSAPDTIIDEAQKEIALKFDLDEGKQFRVREVKLIGLTAEEERGFRAEVDRWVGLPFNMEEYEQLLRDQRHVLPEVAPSEGQSEVRQDLNSRTVDVFVYFRSRTNPCPVSR